MRSGPQRPLLALSAIFACVLLVLPALAEQTAEKPWGAYLKEKGGKAKPLPSKIEKMKDEDWRMVAYTDYMGLKPRVAVYVPPLTNDQITASSMSSDIAKLIVYYTDRNAKHPDGSERPEIQLRQALGATNKFRMVEGSSTVDNLLNEQDFGSSGRVSAASAAQLKHLTGAQYVANVTIMDLNPQKEAKSINLGGGALTGNTLALGSIGVSGTVAYCAINAKLVNVETGEIVCDLTAGGTSHGHGSAFGMGTLNGWTHGLFGAGGVINTETAASLSEAIQAAANKVAYLAAIKVDELPVTMNVLEADERTVTIEGGNDLGLRQGMVLRLESNLGPITNAKGDTLGWKTLDNGQAKVMRVMAKLSTCEFVAGGKDMKRGDLATFEPKATN